MSDYKNEQLPYINSDVATNQVDKMIKGTAGYVIFFGVFTGVCLILQCLRLLLLKFGIDVSFLNENFLLPINTLTTLYASMCCVYIGVDRTTSVIATLKGHSGRPSYGNPERNRHIIIQNFFLCSTSIALNVFFDANLGLEPLLISFGGALILYTSGQKAVVSASKFANDENNNGINDDLEKDKNLIRILNYAFENNKKFRIYYIDLEGKESLEYSNAPIDPRSRRNSYGYSSYNSYNSYNSSPPSMESDEFQN